MKNKVRQSPTNGIPLPHKQRKSQAADVEPGNKAEHVNNRYAQALHKQRISKHPIVISQADEFVSAEPIHAEKSQTQREHHWDRYEDKQPDAVGKNKQPRRERLLA